MTYTLDQQEVAGQQVGLGREWFLWAFRCACDSALDRHDNDHARGFAWTAYKEFDRMLDSAGRFPLYTAERPGEFVTPLYHHALRES